MHDNLDYSQVNPGIVDLVRELRALGYNTTDSGDGVTNREAGMDWAEVDRHVYIVSEDESKMLEDARGLKKHYPDARIDCSWEVGGTAIVSVYPDGLTPPDGCTEVIGDTDQ